MTLRKRGRVEKLSIDLSEVSHFGEAAYDDAPIMKHIRRLVARASAQAAKSKPNAAAAGA
jgi:hypothetical protein